LDEIIYYKGKAVFFNSLSGGEKKRISLGVMLALNDLLVLSGKERSNLIFFDEIADSLDEEGVKGLLELIHLLTKETNKKLFIITHNDYFVSLLEEYCEQLKVVKKNNITKFTK
jgi:DNA repair exonuclease SbcCD ATPase subunit